MITFTSDNIPMPAIDVRKVEQWIKSTAAQYGYSVGDLNYIFCDDEKILAVNQEFLQHDYYTDVITFDYTTRTRVNGDIYISLDTVATNAEQVGAPFLTNCTVSSSTGYFTSPVKLTKRQKPKHK